MGTCHVQIFGHDGSNGVFIFYAVVSSCGKAYEPRFILLQPREKGSIPTTHKLQIQFIFQACAKGVHTCMHTQKFEDGLGTAKEISFLIVLRF